MNSEDSTEEIAAVKEQVRLVEWREEIEARRTSGLSVRAAKQVFIQLYFKEIFNRNLAGNLIIILKGVIP